MILVTALVYFACLIVAIKVMIYAFQVIKLHLSPMSIAIATLVAMPVIGSSTIAWKLAAPMTGQMTVHRKVVQLHSDQYSKEFISKVYHREHEFVKKGEPLYETDPAPNQFALELATAQLAQAQENIKKLEAGLEVAAAAVESANANAAYKKALLDTALTTQQLDPAAIAELEVEVQQQNYAASKAGVEQALASQKEADFALTAAKDSIRSTEAQLATAKLNLAQNVIRAPSDGYIANWQAVVGTMTTTMGGSAQATFMDMTETVIVAIFPQNLLKNVEAGDEVEIAFKSYPGKTATGKVVAVLEYTGEGQLEPSGEIPVVATLQAKGFLAVRIKLDDKELEKELPLGGAGTVAVYTRKFKPLHVMSRISIRIKMWMNYLPI
jgi:multidrug resistance efflux pump